MTAKTKKPYDFSKYQPLKVKDDQTPPLAQQVAHFLDWAAVAYPYQYFGHNVILKAVRKLSYMPKIESKDSEQVRSVMTRAKKILLDKYGRGFDSARGIGCRACVDSEDTIRHDLKDKAKRRVSIDKAIEAVGTKAVRASDLPNTPEGRQLAAFHRDLMRVVDHKALEDKLNQVKLLNPAKKP